LYFAIERLLDWITRLRLPEYWVAGLSALAVTAGAAAILPRLAGMKTGSLAGYMITTFITYKP
jgi:hypothetical protein